MDISTESQFDYVVIGSGIAGLSFALRASQHGRVCVLTKAGMLESNTSYAQGGIAAAVGEADSWRLHEADTLAAGAGLCNPDAVRYLVTKAPEAIQWLISMGAEFDQSGDGDLALGLEGGHSRNRIVHHLDRTGWEIERAVTDRVKSNPAIAVFENAFVTGLAMSDGHCVGATANVEGLGPRRFIARATILATGGCGRMYQHTTNPAVATADGTALASDVGAEVVNMEFMQFHPTTLFHPQLRSFLISEAVRGAGGTLRNHLGRRFMYDYDPRLELAPRDVVARAIQAEMQKHGTWCVYLDTTHLSAETLRSEFPTIYDKLASIDVAMERDWIPVVPAQHYSCGGVTTDLDGSTSIEGLFAAGEVACTGVHGANRLASNSLLEAIVFAFAAADKVRELKPLPGTLGIQDKVRKSIPEAESIRIRRELRRTMTDRVGIVRSDLGMGVALNDVDRLLAAYEAAPTAPFSPHPLETRNLLVAARHVVTGAIARRENVGLHFNVDAVNAELRRTGAAPIPTAKG